MAHYRIALTEQSIHPRVEVVWHVAVYVTPADDEEDRPSFAGFPFASPCRALDVVEERITSFDPARDTVSVGQQMFEDLGAAVRFLREKYGCGLGEVG